MPAEPDNMKQIISALTQLRDAIAPEPPPEHKLKRELEKWLRQRAGFSRSQAIAAVSRVFKEAEQ